MNRKRNIILLGIMILFALLLPNVASSDEHINENVIKISEINQSYQIKEKITYSLPQSNDTVYYSFILPEQASDLKIYVENNVINNAINNASLYHVNLSELNLSKNEITVDLTYFIPLETTMFSKTLYYNTSKTEVFYENEKISSNTNQIAPSTFQVKLTKLTDDVSFNLYTLILIVLLIVIIIVTSWYGFFKKKNGQARKRNFESSEVLTTEKKLLLDVLKEIEKMHRNQKISDDSYHKLKTHYKQQTVEIMSVLEDIKSD